ncbi:DUF6783 domain-containing protein [Robinsoniella peoriensis]
MCKIHLYLNSRTCLKTCPVIPMVYPVLQCLQTRSRACFKIAFWQLCVTLCGRFVPDEGRVAGYVT